MSDKIEPIDLDGLNGIENNTRAILETSLYQIIERVAVSPKLQEVKDDTIQSLVLMAMQNWIIRVQESGRITQAVNLRRKINQ